MKITTWNIRGLNGTSKRRILKNRLFAQHPDIVLLQESKCSSKSTETLKKLVSNSHQCISIDAIGQAGGLITFWNKSKFIVQNALSTKHSLSVIFNMPDSGHSICVTNIYGPQRLQEKLEMLLDLDEVRQHHGADHWILGGDYNMITNLAEKKGGLRRLDKDSEAFNNFIAASKLIDIPTVNGLHTWNNKQGGNRQIASRLDRFLMSESILLHNLDMEASILPIGGSDHWPVKIHFTNLDKPQNRPFRFEAFWTEHPSFMQNIQKWWTQTTIRSDNIMYIFQQKLKTIKTNLKQWNKDTFGNIMQAKK